MDALEYRIEKAINYIVQYTFPDAKITPMHLIFMKHDTQSFHGDYNGRTQTVRVGNLTRPPSHVVITLLHEAAHHCEVCMSGSTGHQRSFYVIYHALMKSAIQIGLFSYETAKTVTDTSSVRQLERYFGPIIETAIPEKKYKLDRLLVCVYDGYDIRDKLKARGYFYNVRSKSWEKEIAVSEKETEQLYLDGFPGITSIFTPDFMTIIIMATITVTGNTYQCKDILKSLNFIFKKSLPSSNVSGWYKTIQSTKIKEYDNAFKILSSYPGVVVNVKY